MTHHKSLRAALRAALFLLAAPAFAAPVTFPGPVIVDDAGNRVTPASITVASVTDLDGVAVSSPGAVAHFAGSNASVVYDVAAHGEAWVTLTPVLTGHTFATNPPVVFCSADPQALASTLSSSQSNGTAVAAVSTKLGTPAGASVSADIAALQTVSSATQTAVNGLPTASANATAVWGAGARSLTDKAGFSLASAPPTVGQIAVGILANPSFPLVTDSSGRVTTSNPATGGSAVTEASIWAYGTRSLTDKTGFSASATNLPSDYQQRGVAVTLPTTPPSGYGGSVSGNVTVGGYAAGQDPATLLLTKSVGHGMTVGQLLVALQAVGAKVATATNSWNASTHVLTTVYTFAGDGSPTLTTSTQYPNTQTSAPPVGSVGAAVGTIAQP